MVLFGHLERIASSPQSLSDGTDIPAIERCFARAHPDARFWFPPGQHVHETYWATFIVDHVYWVGGFGDRAYIGWISAEEWRSISELEINGARLPGEQPNIIQERTTPASSS